MTDQIVEIESKDWKNLRDLFLKEWPNNEVGYYTINNFIRWIEIEPNTKNLHIFSLNGDWSDGTFAVIDRYQLFINTLNKSNERLFKLLQLLDWSHGLKVSTFLARHREPVVRLVEERKLTRIFDDETFLYQISKEDAAKLEVNPPEGITLRPLNESDAEIADKVWPNRHVGSLFFLKRLSRLNPSVGAFTKEGKIVAWSFRLQAGPIGALQVDDQYLGKGFGILICKAITKIIGEMGEDVYACVNTKNVPSIRTFERCGFKVVDHTSWLRTEPTVPFEWSDD